MQTSVDELLRQARRLEDAGESDEALAIYDQLLRQFAEDRATVPDGAAIYVRVGDLRRRLGQPARSFAAYQAAADLYAEAGSSTEIKKLCVRMINVVPAAGDSYVKYAQRLFAHGHADASFAVLREYASKADLEELTNAVEDATRRSTSELGRHVESLLELADQESAGHLAVSRRVLQELHEAVGDENIPSAKPPPSTLRPEIKTSRAPREVATPQVRDARRRAAPGLPNDRTQRPVNWRLVGGAVGGAVAIALAIVTIVSMRGSEQVAASPSPESLADASMAPDAVSADTVTAPVNDPSESANAVVSAPATQTPVAASDPPNTAPATPETQVDTVVSTLVIDQPMVVESLAVQSVTEAQFRGLRGFRVVHLLGSGAEFIVESYPVDSSAAESYPIGTVIVNVVPPDTIVSIARPDADHLVFASGVLPEDSARSLIALLRVRSPSN